MCERVTFSYYTKGGAGRTLHISID